MGWRRWTPLPATIVFTIINNWFFAFGTVSCYLILKEFNQISTIRAFYIKNCIKSPLLGIISCTFPHTFKLHYLDAVCGSRIEKVAWLHNSVDRWINFPSTVILQGKTSLGCSIFRFYCLISWKISPNSNQIWNCRSWVRSARFWDTITIRIGRCDWIIRFFKFHGCQKHPKWKGPIFWRQKWYLLEDGVKIRFAQEFMGHADLKTIEIYTHVMEKDIQAVSSSLETL